MANSGISWADPKVLALAGTIIFSAGGAWVRIAYLSDDVAELSDDIEAEETARVAMDAKIGQDIGAIQQNTQRTAENVARLCQALEVACK
jgi:hypothetical protein